MTSRAASILSIVLLFVAAACGNDDNATRRAEATATPSVSASPTPLSSPVSFVCGNGILEPGEMCEPLEFCRGGCNPATHLCVDISCNRDCTCPAPTCGDGVLDSGEECDPPGLPPFSACDLRDVTGTRFATFGCTAACRCDSPCGDGFRAPHEECDDGNLEDGDGCSSTCTVEVPDR